MPYYIIFSKSAKEHQTVKSLKRIAKKNDIDIEFRLQEKEMVNHSRTGRVTRKYTLVPGYIFARSPESISPETLSILTGANDFFYFLTYSDKSYEMRGDDERYCSQLFDFPQVIRQKNVFIKAGEVVIVTRGAFTTLKGKILKIDMKRERADVEIMILGKPTRISLPIDHVEGSSENENEEKNNLIEN